MYGLIGKKLSHSFSKEIHNLLGNENYELIELDSVEEIIKRKDIDGFNVTIPYKTDIIPFLDEIDDVAKKTLSVNTILRKDNKLFGYNTDYYGLKETFSYNKIDLKNKDVLILGNGSVSGTVEKLAVDLGAKNITKLCRTVRKPQDDLFINFKKYINYSIIINTTPVGMYPNNDSKLDIDLKEFCHIDCLIDLIYNPLRTKLILEADKLNIKTVNGLYMLVMQAKKAHELFFNKEIPLNLANKIYRKFYANQLNYVLVGLPLSGKSKYANLIGKISTKTTKDTDNLIEQKYDSSIPVIFEEYGEKVFRQYEQSIVEDIFKLNSLVISTGGGLIESSTNMEKLKQNGVIIYLNKSAGIISKKKIYGRPLLKNSNDILELSKRRGPLYLKESDIVININKDTNKHLNEIKEKVDEYISR